MYYVAYPDTNDRRQCLPIHRSLPSERDACHTTHHAVACLPIHRVASPVASRYQRSSAVPTDTSLRTRLPTRRLPRMPIHHVVTRHITINTYQYHTINNVVERVCGCVPCVTCKRMFKGRGLSLHASRTGCGYRWFQMDWTTYDARWNEMMQTLPCSCAMK